MSKSVMGIIYAALAGICWGTYGTFVAILSNMGYSETTIAICGPAVMVLFFLICALVKNPSGLKLNKKGIIIYLAVGLVGVIGSNWCYAKGITAGTPVAVASVLTFLNYFLVVVIARVVWKNKITPAKIISGIVAIFGIVLILQVWTTLSITIHGLLWMITVIVAFAVGYSLCNYAVGEGYDYDAYLFWTNLVAIVALSFLMPPWGIVAEISVSVSHHGAVSIIALLGLGLIPMVGSYFFLLRAFANLEAPLVVIMYSLDPIVAAILGYFVLGQPLSVIQILGMGVVIAALAWLQLIERKEQKTREDNQPTQQAAKSL